MAYTNSDLGSWFGEAAGSSVANLANSRSAFEVWSDGKSFAEHFEDLYENYKTNAGIDIKKDLGPMVSDRGFMEGYKMDMMEPIFEGFRNISEHDPHIESHIENVSRLWDAKVRQYSESASTTAFLPIATLEFPVLVKQFFASITKDIIEVETVKTPNIVKHIKTLYLVNNETGDMYEYPRCIFDGTWEKIWDAAKGLPFDSELAIPISGGQCWNFDLIHFGTTGTLPGGPPTGGVDPDAHNWINQAQKLSFNIRIVAIDYDNTANGGTLDGTAGKGERIPLRGNGITIELSTGGTLVNGDLNFEYAGEVVEDVVSGKVNFQQGTMSISSANGQTTAIYLEGYLSNENNVRNVSVREQRTLQKFMIEDGPRWNMPFSIEEIEDASALLDMNYYNRMVDEIVRTQEMIEGQTVLKFFDDEFKKYDGIDTDIYNLESIVHRGFVDLNTPVGFAGDPFQYMANAVQFALKGMIHKLTDAAKLDKLSFVIIGNPMATQLLSEWTTWKMEQGASIGGIQVNNSYGFATDMGASVRVVASNQIKPYTDNTVTTGNYPTFVAPTGYTAAKELKLRVIAYPTDPEHVSFRHLKYTSHLLATPAQSAYMAGPNAPNGAYNIVTATSRYKDIAIQGLQCELIMINSQKIYGRKS